MKTFIRFTCDMREDDFDLIIPSDIKNEVIYIFETLGKRNDITASIIIDNIDDEGIFISNLHTMDSLGEELNYLTTGVDDDDFNFDVTNLKKQIIKVAHSMQIDYVDWNWSNLLEEVLT